MNAFSNLRFGLSATALLVSGCGSVIDDGGKASGSGGSMVSATGAGGAGATSGGSTTGSGGKGACPSTAWSLAHASLSGNGNASGQSIAVDAACNVLVAGAFQGQLDLGAGALGGAGENLFVAKLDPEGHTLWSSSHAVGSWLSEVHVALDPSGNVLLTGDASGGLDFGDDCVLGTNSTTLFVAKLDGDGKSIFCHGLVSETPWPNRARSVASNAAGEIIVGGSFGGTLDFGAGTIAAQGDQTGFVLDLDPTGKFRWMVPLSDAGSAHVQAVTISPEGVVHAGGDFGGTLDLGLGLALTSVGGRDLFVTEISADGKPTWAHRFGGVGDDTLVAMAPGPDGGLVLAGEVQSGIDLGSGPLTGGGSAAVLVARLDAAGKAIGGQLHGEGGAQLLDSMAVDDVGDALLSGRYQGTIDLGGGPLPSAKPGSWSGFAAKLAPDGKPIWSRGFGELGSPGAPTAVALDRSSNAMITGAFQTTIDLGTGPLTSLTAIALFVAKVAP
jgi:hypothetical protein